MFSLAIVYRSAAGRPLSVATIEDPRLLEEAATLALREAYDKADHISTADPVLGRIQREEASKLKRVLSALFSPRASAVTQ
jgi:hypothetical protein